MSIIVLAMGVLNVGDGLEGSFQSLEEYEFISSTLSGKPKDMVGSDASGNRFRETILGSLPVPLPRNYVLGIDLQKWDFEANKPAYLRGEVRRGGWWYYYLYGLLVKVPTGTWILAMLACLLARRTQRQGTARLRDELLLIVPVVTVLLLASNQVGINKHMRYVLPIAPFAFIWISRVAASIDWKHRRLASAMVATSLLASITSSLLVYPHSLSYFNELSGGPTRGSFHLLSSNIAWGQDMLYLKEWLDEHPEARPFHLAAHCGFDPQIAGIDFTVPPKQPIDDTSDVVTESSWQPPPGWYAVDANMLRGYPYTIPDGTGGRTEAHRPYFTYFQDRQFTARIGYSIFIYHVGGTALTDR